MSIDSSDPRLTAYALDEMDEQERAAFEALLADDPDAQAEVEAIRDVAGQLTQELAGEPCPALTAEQKQSVQDEATARRSVPRLWRVVGTVAGLAAAATILVGVFLPALNQPREKRRASSAGNRKVAGLPLRTTGEDGGRLLAPGAVGRLAQELDGKGTVDEERADGSLGHPPELAMGNADAGATEKAKAVRRPWGSLRQRQKAGEEPATTPIVTKVTRQMVMKPAAKSLSTAMPASVAPAKPAPGTPAVPRPRPESGAAEMWGADTGQEGFNREAYDRIVDNPFLAVSTNRLSTFSIDVDTASYANIRRFLKRRQLPPKDAVRIEEMVNYFVYDYPQPTGSDPFSVNVEVAGCPWKSDHRLVRIGLKGKEIDADKRPASNLVFLLDVSGSMRSPNKLPLLKQAMKMLVNNLGENDSVAITVYAGASGLVLPSTTGDRKEVILEALERLQAGGSTNGGAGIQLAYRTATEGFIEGGINRVILATDGDFNVGVTSEGDLTRLIEEKAKSGVFLTVLGFGSGNYQDARLEKLADKGNGNYAYVDTRAEARKVLVEQMGATLVTIAKDVKIQVEFNPAQVTAYRLIGYENRLLRKEDFNDDTKDAGEIGAGHTVTAFYEVVPRGVPIELPNVDALKYQVPKPTPRGEAAHELLTVKLRYKQPDGDRSKLLQVPVVDDESSYGKASNDYKFAGAVAAFGMILRESPYKGSASLDGVLELADEAMPESASPYRREFLELVRAAKQLKARQ